MKCFLGVAGATSQIKAGEQAGCACNGQLIMDN